MYDRALASLPGGNTRTTVFMKPFPIYATHGVGYLIWDADGTERIDCINNFTAGIHGHAHPSLIEASVRVDRHEPYANSFEAFVRESRATTTSVRAYDGQHATRVAEWSTTARGQALSALYEHERRCDR